MCSRSSSTPISAFPEKTALSNVFNVFLSCCLSDASVSSHNVILAVKFSKFSSKVTAQVGNEVTHWASPIDPHHLGNCKDVIGSLSVHRKANRGFRQRSTMFGNSHTTSSDSDSINKVYSKSLSERCVRRGEVVGRRLVGRWCFLAHVTLPLIDSFQCVFDGLHRLEEHETASPCSRRAKLMGYCVTASLSAYGTSEDPASYVKGSVSFQALQATLRSCRHLQQKKASIRREASFSKPRITAKAQAPVCR